MSEGTRSGHEAIWARKAARRIRELGWVQGELASDAGVCLLGALEEVSESVYADIAELEPRDSDIHDVHYRTWQRLLYSIDTTIPDDSDSLEVVERIAEWNDNFDRTEREVLEVLDELAGRWDPDDE